MPATPASHGPDAAFESSPHFTSLSRIKILRERLDSRLRKRSGAARDLVRQRIEQFEADRRNGQQVCGSGRLCDRKTELEQFSVAARSRGYFFAQGAREDRAALRRRVGARSPTAIPRFPPPSAKSHAVPADDGVRTDGIAYVQTAAIKPRRSAA